MSIKDDQVPLRCKAVGGDIEMGVGMNVLAFAAESHPDFWDGESGLDVPNIKITDRQEFARAAADKPTAVIEYSSTSNSIEFEDDYHYVQWTYGHDTMP